METAMFQKETDQAIRNVVSHTQIDFIHSAYFLSVPFGQAYYNIGKWICQEVFLEILGRLVYLHSNADKHQCRDREEQAQVDFVVVDSYSNHGTNQAEDSRKFHTVSPLLVSEVRQLNNDRANDDYYQTDEGDGAYSSHIVVLLSVPFFREQLYYIIGGRICQ